MLPAPSCASALLFESTRQRVFFVDTASQEAQYALLKSKFTTGGFHTMATKKKMEAPKKKKKK
jgi:hypothetical protein